LTPIQADGITISLAMLEFGQLREKPQKSEQYKISWTKDGVLATKYDDEVRISLPIGDARGTWMVRVQLLTDEVRKDLNGVLQDSATFEIQ
jgi:hypothetical protein